MANHYVFVNASSTSGGDGKVNVTLADSTRGFLDEKLTVGSTKITKTVTNPGGNETLEIDVDQTQIDHNLLLNYESNEHIDHTTVDVIAGDGLSGGGSINTSRTLDVNIAGETDKASPVSLDEILISDSEDSNNIKRADIGNIAQALDHTQLQNIGTNSHSAIDTHIADLSIHRELDDALTTTTNLWSADKIQTELDLKEDTANKGIANGYASLDSGGKVPVAQLPNSILQYKGTWDASTNTPTLVDGAGNPDENIGDVYRVSVAGTQDLGSGSITFGVGDYVILNDSKIWEKSDNTDAVTSVFGRVGVVVAQASDYDANQIDYDNSTSGLAATQVQAAIDEVEARVDSVETGKQDDVITTEGDLVLGNGSGDAARLPIGSSDQVLQSNGTTASWQTLNLADERVKVSSNDTTEKFLEDALVVSEGVNTSDILEVTTLNDGGDEDLQIQIDETKIDHDSLENFVTNEHIDHSSVNINTNVDSGLSGGGDITTSRTLTVDITGTTSETSVDNADLVLIHDDSAGQLKSMNRADFLSGIALSSTGDISELSFTLVNNQTTPANISGFTFSNGTVRSFQAVVSILVDATSDLYEEREIQGIQKGADWEISQSAVGDNSLVDIDITSAGQITYTTPNYAGFVDATIKFRAITTSV